MGTHIVCFSGINEVQLSALIEAMHEPWDAALTSNLSICGLCQLLYLMTITVQPWTRISDLRVEFKYSKLLKRLTNAFNAVKMEQTHWNRVCTMIGNGISLLTEDALNQCALQLGWQPTWMTETQNNTRRTIVPATEYGAMRAFIRPTENNPEAVGIPVPQFRGAVHPEGVDEGMTSSPPPARIRRRTIPPRAIVRANQANLLPSEPVNVEAAEDASANVAPALNAPPDHERSAARDGIEDVARNAVVVPVPEPAAADPRPEVAEIPPPVAPGVPVEEAVPEAPMLEAPLAGAPDPEAPNPEAPMVPEAIHAPNDGGEAPRRPLPNVELCAFCQCPNVEDEEHGPMVKLNCIHSWHRNCLQDWMDSGDLSFEDACPVRCHLGLV